MSESLEVIFSTLKMFTQQQEFRELFDVGADEKPSPYRVFEYD